MATRNLSGVERHSSVVPVKDSSLSSLQNASPRTDAHRLALECDSLRASSILSLLHHCGPPAILRRVITIVVDSVKRVAPRRTRSHIGQESRKRLAPARTDGDATATVPCVEVSGLVFAPPNHAFPHAILWGATQSMCCMGYVSGVSVQAPATRSRACSQGASRNCVLAPALTRTEPIHLVPACTQRTHHGESPESLSRLATTRSLVVLSDVHCGCRLGMLHPDGIVVDSGGLYLPSVFQQKMWLWWLEFWGEWVPSVTKGG